MPGFTTVTILLKPPSPSRNNGATSGIAIIASGALLCAGTGNEPCRAAGNIKLAIVRNAETRREDLSTGPPHQGYSGLPKWSSTILWWRFVVARIRPQNGIKKHATSSEAQMSAR
jgi:hypothetical protein